jgi:hypothetical protein
MQPVLSPAEKARIRSPESRVPLPATLAAAATIAAKPLFMSAAPRPYRRPSAISAAKGGWRQSPSPVGMVSMWAENTSAGPPPPVIRASTLMRPGRNSSVSISSPSDVNWPATKGAISDSSPGGSGLGWRISAASSSVSSWRS